VAELLEQVQADTLKGATGIAHTRWATHGAPAVHNAHPHFSHGTGRGRAGAPPGRVALVHNGIIENHEELRARCRRAATCLPARPTPRSSRTWSTACTTATCSTRCRRRCRNCMAPTPSPCLHKDEPHRVVGARAGSPLILGVGSGHGENFLASDAMALAGVTDQIVYLEEGDVVDLQLGRYWIVDKARKPAGGSARCKTVQAHSGAAELGPYRHYMQKEIFEQPRAIADTLEGVQGIVPELFGDARRATARVQGDRQVLILACGTSYYSGCAAKYWLEAIAGIPTQVEVASEYRYRESRAQPRTLVVTISQAARPPTPWPRCATRSRWA
jgi:glucosamine--fructose-6-phosphate aminotransferase (isomerizing)